MPPDSHAVTRLLHQFADGEKAALDQLVPLVYDELRRLADGQLRRERAGHTLQPTALVHEVYTRMIRQDQPDYRDRAHFLGIAAQLMRKILIDHARTHNALKRGGGAPKLDIDEARDAALPRPAIILELDEALQTLEKRAPRQARLIEMHYFGGLTAAESAEALGIEIKVVRGELRLAQAWLQRELERSPDKR